MTTSTRTKNDFSYKTILRGINKFIYALQWNLSRADMLYNGHLSLADTFL